MLDRCMRAKSLKTCFVVCLYSHVADRGGSGGTTGDADAKAFVGTSYALRRRMSTMISYTNRSASQPGVVTRPPLPTTIFLATDDASQVCCSPSPPHFFTTVPLLDA